MISTFHLFVKWYDENLITFIEIFKVHLDRYEYIINKNFLDYEFISKGPKGTVKKVIRFTIIAKNVYNLAFGDLNEVSGKISDIIVTNNNDSRKVLATVAASVHDFTKQFPGAIILAKGSTNSRTRLYRMGITNYWKIISIDFEVYGLKGTQWELFELRQDYDAFLVYRK